MPMTLLAAADIHIGRRPTRLPSPEDAQRCSAAAMWGRIVETAIDRKVDALVLAGDVVESDNQYYEALGRLEKGFSRLGDNGIHTYAVSGNHDYEVFPRILETLGGDHLHLVGRGGNWETMHHTRDGAQVLQIHGWSFPSQYVETSPLNTYGLPADSRIPTIGILHGEVDMSDSRYAPVTTRQLEETDADFWIMGHVHEPKFLGENKVLYTGSPQALDPGEQGDHGPWLIHIHDKRDIRCEHLVMSCVRYEGLTVDLDGAETEDEFRERLVRDTGKALDRTAAFETPPTFSLLRLSLEGATPLCSKLDGLARTIPEDLERSVGKVTGRIDKITNNTRPAIDLADVAKRQDPTGILAGALIRMQEHDDDDEIRRLLQRALDRLRLVHQHPTFDDLKHDTAPGLEDARRLLVHQGLKLLETLRAQRVPS